MSMPSPFEIGRAVGGNISGAIRGAAETSSLDQILQQAMQSDDPNVQNDVMRQILTRVSPEKRPAALEVLQNKTAQMQRAKQSQAMTQEGFNPDLPEYINKERAKTLAKASDEKKNAAVNSLDLLEQQKKLLKSGHIGPKVSALGTSRKLGSTFSSEGQIARSEFKQLGKALIQAAAPLKITNRAEFQHYAQDIEDPTRTVEEIQGSLNAMERIIKNAMGERGNQNEPNNETAQNSEFVQMRSPDGVVRNIPRNQVQAAQAAGGTLVQ